MISYLIDTDWIIDFLKGEKKIVEKIASKINDGLSVSIISLAELYEGIYTSDNTEKHLKGLNAFLTGVTVIGIDDEICKLFFKRKTKLRK